MNEKEKKVLFDEYVLCLSLIKEGSDELDVIRYFKAQALQLKQLICTLSKIGAFNNYEDSKTHELFKGLRCIKEV